MCVFGRLHLCNLFEYRAPPYICVRLSSAPSLQACNLESMHRMTQEDESTLMRTLAGEDANQTNAWVCSGCQQRFTLGTPCHKYMCKVEMTTMDGHSWVHIVPTARALYRSNVGELFRTSRFIDSTRARSRSRTMQ